MDSSATAEARLFAFLGYLTSLYPLPALQTNYPADSAASTYGLDEATVAWIRYYDILGHLDNADMRNTPAADMNALARYTSALAQQFHDYAHSQHQATALFRQHLFTLSTAPSALPLAVAHFQQRTAPMLQAEIMDLRQLLPCLD